MNVCKSAVNSGAVRSLKLKGYVGFDKIASQFVEASTKNGFAFNILCIGKKIYGKYLSKPEL